MTKENNIDLPHFTIRQLLEAGVHFGHKTMRRNTKMSKYIYGARNGVSIIDLQQTHDLLINALKVVRDIAKSNGRILFVATKKQAQDSIADAAKRCGQYYVNHRWLGGMLTNWKTVSGSIKTLKKIEDRLADDKLGLNKKEKLVLERDRLKLEMTLGGIKNIGSYPDLVFVIDTYRESLAIAEAKKLGIPIMAILDTNCLPDGITYPIPGNDDSVKAIRLYCRLLSDAILSGIRENMSISGVDLVKMDSNQEAQTKSKSDHSNSEGAEISMSERKNFDKKSVKKVMTDNDSKSKAGPRKPSFGAKKSTTPKKV